MIYHVYANQKNIGDWLSARAIQLLIGGGPVVELFCDGPYVKQTLAVLANAGPGDLVVIGGGGLFMDYFVPFWEGFLPIAPRVRFCIGWCRWMAVCGRRGMRTRPLIRGCWTPGRRGSRGCAGHRRSSAASWP